MATDRPHRSAFTLLEVVIVIAILALLMALTFSAVQRARDSVMRTACLSNLHQIGLALHHYHEIHSSLPPGVSRPASLIVGYGDDGSDANPFPLLAWPGRLLPFIEQESLWSLSAAAYAQDRYFINNPPHIGLVAPVPVFICPADGRRGRPGSSLETSFATTSYLGISGINQYRRDGVFYLDSRIRLTDVTDGASSTLAVGERPPSFDLAYGRWYGGWGHWGTANSYLGVRELGVGNLIDSCLDGPYAFTGDYLQNPCSPFHYWSMHSGGANFLFADGSVRFLPYSAAPILPALATRAGGEVIDWNF